MPKVSGGPGRGGHPPHPRFFQDPLRWAGCMFARLLPTHRGLWQPLGALGSGQRLGPKEREVTNAAGDAHLGTWPSCLGELATHIAVVGAEVVKTPVSQLERTVELGTDRSMSVLGPVICL